MVIQIPNTSSCWSRNSDTKGSPWKKPRLTCRVIQPETFWVAMALLLSNNIWGDVSHSPLFLLDWVASRPKMWPCMTRWRDWAGCIHLFSSYWGLATAGRNREIGRNDLGSACTLSWEGWNGVTGWTIWPGPRRGLMQVCKRLELGELVAAGLIIQTAVGLSRGMGLCIQISDMKGISGWENSLREWLGRAD